MRVVSRSTKRILLLCLCILLASLVGHFISDIAGISVDFLDILHPHSEFVLQPLLTVAALSLIASFILATYSKATHWLKSPATPPPISVC